LSGRGLTAKVAGERAAQRRPRRMRRSFGVRTRKVLRSVTIRLSSSLTRRIVVLNLGGLVALLLLFLYVNQFREGLIDARVQSLQTQGEIIAAAISARASATTDSFTVDPEKLLQMAPGQGPAASEEDNPLEFSINPERVGPVLRRLVSPTRTRAIIFGKDGEEILDSHALSLPGAIQQLDAPRTRESQNRTLIERTWNEVKRRFGRTEVPLGDEKAGDGAGQFPEVARALKGATQSVVRVNTRGETIVSVAIPIQYSHTIRGALLLSTRGGDIDKIIASERWALLRVFLVAAGVTFVLSLFLAGTIAGPMRRLAEAAERVRRGVNSREEIPDFTARADEIGHLSSALRDMTDALYTRMEATESFAADVAHELKNPLTSLRSAVETLPRIKSEESRDRLMSVIQHDIRRLNRLISDISDASRLDAELARGRTATLDVAALLGAVANVANEVDRGDDVRFELAVAPVPRDDGRPRSDGYKVEGHDSRLGQVVNNLIDNARSFSAPGSTVRIGLRRARRREDEDGDLGVEITVDDDGPGIPAHAFERIFERFYTDRPGQGFGQNSGLGLSISRQIIEAHGGEIWAANRLQPREDGDEDLDRDGSETDEDRVLGARFTVWLPSRR
jgi:two-component system sensor histidine kinase ChvG